MKAIISELWNTGIKILTTEADENEITSLADLRKCENVIVDKKVKGCPFTTVMVDNDLYDISFRKVSHPTGCGKLWICEI